MSTEETLLSNLSTALNSRGPEEIQRALTSYLKSDEGMALPPVKSNMFKSPTLNYSCGISYQAGAEAAECAQLITKCLKGEDDCIEEFVNLSEKIARGVVFTYEADDQIIRNVLRSLGIDINAKKPVEDWLARISTKKPEIATKIASIKDLIKILKTFVVKALNPSFNTDQVNEALNKSDIGIPKRKGFESEKVIYHIGQIPKRKNRNGQRGGGEDIQIRDTFSRFIDGI